jgi:hypothetical protein
MLPKCILSKDNSAITKDHLFKFAIQGLRTLVMAKKKISQVFFGIELIYVLIELL